MSSLIITDPSYTVGLLTIISDPSLTRQERERTSARMLATEMLGNDCTISHYPDGAPYIAGREAMSISVSHSAATCAFGIATDTIPFGIDIESPRPQLERVRTKYLTPEEETQLSEITSPGRRMDFLLRCWTAKEAVYKADRTPGLGLKEIKVNASFTGATTPNHRYTLGYHTVGEGEILCAACGTVN